jgi:hypothetical protein
MKYLLFISLFAMIFLIGCSSPKSGDWYENIETRERIKIESIGTGKIEHTVLKELADTMNKVTPCMIVLGGHSSDSLIICFTYSKKERISGHIFIVYYIRPIDELKTDYLKIN